MKTHIIHLEHDDNVVSITDKLSWGKAHRVLLVYPPSHDLKLKKFELLLIQRAAKKRGFSLGIISRSKGVNKSAGELKIPIFKSIKHAQRRTWVSFGNVNKKNFARKSINEIDKLRMGSKSTTPEWASRIGVRLSFFSFGVLAVLLICLLFIPSADIELNLPDKIQSITLEVTADETVENINLSGVIPVHTLSVEVEGKRLVAVTSKSNMPDEYSVGNIKFTNLTETQIDVPLGTIIARLDNSGFRFETTERGVVAAGIGQTIELPIRALTPGEAGNMEANSLGSLVGDLGASLLATNPTPSNEGADRITIMPNQRDRADLYNLLEADLRAEAIKVAQVELLEGDIIFPDSVKLENILNENYVPAEGQSGDRLALDLKLSYKIQYASYSDLIRLGESAMKAAIPDGFSALPEDSIVFRLLDKPSENMQGKTTLNLQVNQKIRKDISTLNIPRLVQGLSVQEAYSILKEKLGAEIKPAIEKSPSWWPWLPNVALRIAVNY